MVQYHHPVRRYKPAGFVPYPYQEEYAMKHMHRSIDRSLMNLLICVAEILIGALLLLNPLGFTSTVLIALGILSAVLGVTQLLGYFRAQPELAAQSGGLVTGLVLLLAGLFCIFRWEWFVVTFPILTVVYGVLTLINGLNKLQWAVDALRLHQRFWYVAMIGAVLTLLFAGLILINPFTSTAFLWTFIAISLIVEAVMDLFSLVLGRR